MNGFTASPEIKTQMQARAQSQIQGQAQVLKPTGFLDKVKQSARKKIEKIRDRMNFAKESFADTFEAEAVKSEMLKGLSANRARDIDGRIFGYLVHAHSGEKRQLLEGDNLIVDNKGRLVRNLPGLPAAQPLRLRAARDFLETDDATSETGWKRYQSNEMVRVGNAYYLLKVIPEKYRKTVTVTTLIEKELGETK